MENLHIFGCELFNSMKFNDVLTHVLKYGNLKDSVIRNVSIHWKISNINNFINLQISQFVISLVHSIQVLFLKDCDVPSGVAWFEIASLLTIVFIYYIFVILPKHKQTSYLKTMILPATEKMLTPVKLTIVS